MPKYSVRETLLKELNEILFYLVLDEDENKVECQEILDLIAYVESNRYTEEKFSGAIPKSTWVKENLLNLPEREFNSLTRMSKISFLTLNELIKDHQIFKNKSKNKQAEVWFQLAVVLARLGTDGTGSSIQRTAFLTGVGYGTIELYTTRIFTAILSMKKDYIFWFIT
jgi:hypothetical protein